MKFLAFPLVLIATITSMPCTADWFSSKLLELNTLHLITFLLMKPRYRSFSGTFTMHFTLDAFLYTHPLLLWPPIETHTKLAFFTKNPQLEEILFSDDDCTQETLINIIALDCIALLFQCVVGYNQGNFWTRTDHDRRRWKFPKLFPGNTADSIR